MSEEIKSQAINDMELFLDEVRGLADFRGVECLTVVKRAEINDTMIECFGNEHERALLIGFFMQWCLNQSMKQLGITQ